MAVNIGPIEKVSDWFKSLKFGEFHIGDVLDMVVRVSGWTTIAAAGVNTFLPGLGPVAKGALSLGLGTVIAKEHAESVGVDFAVKAPDKYMLYGLVTVVLLTLVAPNIAAMIAPGATQAFQMVVALP